MQNIWLHPECMLILSTCADSVWHFYRMNADPEPISRFRSQKLHCFIQPTIQKAKQYSMLESHRTKEMQGKICGPVRRLVLVLSVCTWVQSLSQLCRSAGGRSSSIQRLTVQTCRTNRGRRRRERTSADRTDVSLKTRQTDVDIMLHRWCKVCCCCSRFLMFS